MRHLTRFCHSASGVTSPVPALYFHCVDMIFRSIVEAVGSTYPVERPKPEVFQALRPVDPVNKHPLFPKHPTSCARAGVFPTRHGSLTATFRTLPTNNPQSTRGVGVHHLGARLALGSASEWHCRQVGTVSGNTSC